MTVIAQTYPNTGAPYIGAWLNEAGFGGSAEGALMFLNALEIQRADQRILDSLSKIQHAAKLRQYLNERMNKINELKSFINQHGKGEPKQMTLRAIVERMYGLKPPEKPDLPPTVEMEETKINNNFGFSMLGKALQDAAGYGEEMTAYERAKAEYDTEAARLESQLVETYGLDRPTYDIDPATGRLVIHKEGLLGKSPGTANHTISVDDLGVVYEQYKSAADTADNMRALELIMVQNALSRKQQLITLITNTMKKVHETQGAVIRNI